MKINKSELFCYIVFAIIAIIGFVFTLTGIILSAIDFKKYVLFCTYFGLIIFSIAIISIVIVLLSNDKKNKEISNLKCQQYKLDEIITDDIQDDQGK